MKQAIQWSEVVWVVSWFSVDIWPHVTQLFVTFLHFDTKAPGLWLVQGGGGAPNAAASSQQSVEFDAGLKAARSFWKAAIDVENNKQNLNVIVFQMRR